ncbi:MAG: PEGA domain-containing protein [Pseudomonadota bacterium]
MRRGSDALRHTVGVLLASLFVIVAVLAGTMVPMTAMAADVPSETETPSETGQRTGQAVRILLTPLVSLTERSMKLGALETLVQKAFSSLPGAEVIPASELRRAAKRLKHPAPEICEGDDSCLAGLAKPFGASHVLAGEVNAVGDGYVVYLRAVNATTAVEAASTTALLLGSETQQAGEARAAAYRLFAPQSYVGTLRLTVDVAGATVYLDGERIGASPLSPCPVSVGTHALRVTHERYRDWMHFVEVDFDKTASYQIDLTSYPVVSERMEKLAVDPLPIPVPTAPLPWYRRGWLVAGACVVLAASTAAIVALATEAHNHDYEVPVGRR